MYFKIFCDILPHAVYNWKAEGSIPVKNILQVKIWKVWHAH